MTQQMSKIHEEYEAQSNETKITGLHEFVMDELDNPAAHWTVNGISAARQELRNLHADAIRRDMPFAEYEMKMDEIFIQSFNS